MNRGMPARIFRREPHTGRMTRSLLPTKARNSYAASEFEAQGA